MNEIVVYCDGGSRGNPGPAAAAFAVKRNEALIHEDSKFLGITTNNIAEYSAVLMALTWLNTGSEIVDADFIKFVLDSELIVRQINGVYKVKNEKLKNLHARVLSLIKKFGKGLVFVNVSREKNKTADKLVNDELDKLS